MASTVAGLLTPAFRGLRLNPTAVEYVQNFGLSAVASIEFHSIKAAIGTRLSMFLVIGIRFLEVGDSSPRKRSYDQGF